MFVLNANDKLVSECCVTSTKSNIITNAHANRDSIMEFLVAGGCQYCKRVVGYAFCC